MYVQKKDLSSAQNLGNKGPEISLPPRSMVLNVVIGKIFKTWKLWWFSAACGSILELQVKAGCPEAGLMVRLSKIVDYLVDNIYALMLSQVMG